MILLPLKCLRLGESLKSACHGPQRELPAQMGTMESEKLNFSDALLGLGPACYSLAVCGGRCGEHAGPGSWWHAGCLTLWVGAQPEGSGGVFSYLGQ